jgi:hypothetical protein
LNPPNVRDESSVGEKFPEKQTLTFFMENEMILDTSGSMSETFPELSKFAPPTEEEIAALAKFLKRNSDKLGPIHCERGIPRHFEPIDFFIE